MKIFNLVYKIKKAKTKKSCAVDRLKMEYIKKRFIKSLPICKYVNPLNRSYLKCIYIHHPPKVSGQGTLLHIYGENVFVLLAFLSQTY